ncbi:MAG: lamin tail domain-containing protein, partial [Myxococcales bacterium]|nr:lamin tail domain-containing protein [Myxococcales bacterium]
LGAAHTVTSADCVSVKKGDHILFARELDTAKNGGLPATAIKYAGPSMTNGSGNGVYIAILGVVRDQVVWTTSKNGYATSLDPKGQVTWCNAGVADKYGPEENFGTPGAANPACPGAAVCGDSKTESPETCDDGNKTPGDGCDEKCQVEVECGDGDKEGSEECDDGNKTSGDGCDDKCKLEAPPPCTAGVDAGTLLITELMAKSQSGTDNGEWIEIHNAGTEEIQLTGCLKLRNKTTDAPVTGGVGKVMIPAGGFSIIGRSDDPKKNHGAPVTFVQSKFYLTNSGLSGDNKLSLFYGGAVMDELQYSAAQVKEGVSTQLSSDKLTATDNDDPKNWCPSTKTYGTAGKNGTPGAANDSCSSS